MRIRGRYRSPHTPTEFELGDTAADIQRTREEREQTEKEQAEKQQREERQREEARRVQTRKVIHRGGSGQKKPRTERSESKIDTEDGGGATTSTECQSRCKAYINEYLFINLR